MDRLYDFLANNILIIGDSGQPFDCQSCIQDIIFESIQFVYNRKGQYKTISEVVKYI
jgi:hypothetical protein